MLYSAYISEEKQWLKDEHNNQIFEPTIEALKDRIEEYEASTGETNTYIIWWANRYRTCKEEVYRRDSNVD